MSARCGDGKLEAIEAGLGEAREGDLMEPPAAAAGDLRVGNCFGDLAGAFSRAEGDLIRGDLIIWSGLTLVWSTLTVSWSNRLSAVSLLSMDEAPDTLLLLAWLALLFLLLTDSRSESSLLDLLEW